MAAATPSSSSVKGMVVQVLIMGMVFLVALASSLPMPKHVYIVHLRGKPRAAYVEPGIARSPQTFHTASMQAQATYLESMHDSVLKNTLQEGSYHKLYSYKTSLNAFAVKLSDAHQVEFLRGHPNVLRIEEDRVFEKMTTHTPHFLKLDSGPWKMNGGVNNAGENVVIGLLDTGIDPTHPSFKGSREKPYSPLPHWKGKCEVERTFPEGSCNHKIVAARHFDQGIIAANIFNASYDFNSPRDGNGHGTHTSSVAAGNHGIPVVVNGYNYGNASGAAPRARLAIYKVLYRDGGYLTDVLAGIDQALEDGVDILSISLGATIRTDGVPFLNSFDIALLYAVKIGIVVVHAAGNNGPRSLSMNSFGPWMISVASGSTDRTYNSVVLLRNQQKFTGIGLSAPSPGKELYRMIFSKDAFSYQTPGSFDVDYYSNCPDPRPFNKTLVQGKILICNLAQFTMDSVGPQVKAAARTARDLNAVGLIVIRQTSEGLTGPDTVNVNPFLFTIPGTLITSIDDSAILLDFYNELTLKDELGKANVFGATARITDSREPRFASQAPKVVTYSSRGPVYADSADSVIAEILKPDILAPGNQIWGAWTAAGIDISSYKGENFAMLSGTSIAAPHIAGIAALLKQKHPKWSNAAIRSALLTTALLYDNIHKPIQAEQPEYNTSLPQGWASPFDCGSGAVNATAALDPGLIFDVGFQDYVNFLCTVPGVDINMVQELTEATCVTKLGARGSDLNLPSITLPNLIGTRRVVRRVTSVGEEEETYEAMAHAPPGVGMEVNPRSLTLKPGESASFAVTLKARQSNQAFTYGRLIWTGNRGHIVRMVLAISANFVAP